MTKGTLAATIVADAILERPNRFAAFYDAKRLNARQSAPSFARGNTHAARRFIGDRLRRRGGLEAAERLEAGEGTVIRSGTRQYAVCRDDTGSLHVLSARCPHLGCLVGWNPADRIWECPCHGSCFASDGSLLAGPATEGLSQQSLPQ